MTVIIIWFLFVSLTQSDQTKFVKQNNDINIICAENGTDGQSSPFRTIGYAILQQSPHAADSITINISSGEYIEYKSSLINFSNTTKLIGSGMDSPANWTIGSAHGANFGAVTFDGDFGYFSFQSCTFIENRISQDDISPIKYSKSFIGRDITFKSDKLDNPNYGSFLNCQSSSYPSRIGVVYNNPSQAFENLISYGILSNDIKINLPSIQANGTDPSYNIISAVIAESKQLHKHITRIYTPSQAHFFEQSIRIIDGNFSLQPEIQGRPILTHYSGFRQGRKVDSNADIEIRALFNIYNAVNGTIIDEQWTMFIPHLISAKTTKTYGKIKSWEVDEWMGNGVLSVYGQLLQKEYYQMFGESIKLQQYGELKVAVLFGHYPNTYKSEWVPLVPGKTTFTWWQILIIVSGSVILATLITFIVIVIIYCAYKRKKNKIQVVQDNDETLMSFGEYEQEQSETNPDNNSMLVEEQVKEEAKPQGS
ncbi:MAG: hypothetical protein EZS28_009004 [Streblomastix strix]|uniref:Pectinesterase n=1 Tax=Streblomastix strix TaxID=222440 RepID=A0A5J4WKT6_9EUKA|nr:MAG: hypothetical protein EZS28_009004 [Streblomastix strix]